MMKENIHDSQISVSVTPKRSFIECVVRNEPINDRVAVSDHGYQVFNSNYITHFKRLHAAVTTKAGVQSKIRDIFKKITPHPHSVRTMPEEKPESSINPNASAQELLESDDESLESDQGNDDHANQKSELDNEPCFSGDKEKNPMRRQRYASSTRCFIIIRSTMPYYSTIRYFKMFFPLTVPQLTSKCRYLKKNCLY